mgnify:CR=1 FL=1
MTTRCTFCDEAIEPGEVVTIEEGDDPRDQLAGDVAHDECLRRHRASLDQLRRMFSEKDYNEHSDIEDPIADFDEDDLAAEIDELEAELADEMNDDE